MARNTTKEAAWAKERYDQFKFQIDKDLGTAFREHLRVNGIKATDWFREAVNNTIERQAIPERNIHTLVKNLQVLASNLEISIKDILVPVEVQVDEDILVPVKVQVDKKPAQKGKGQRQPPMFNPFAVFAAQGIDSLRESLMPLDKEQLRDIIVGYQFNRHPSKDTTTVEGKHKRYNVFHINTPLTLVNYILDVVPVASQEDRYKNKK